MLGASCGKVGAPVPPARITARATELTAIQRGGAVLLSWPAPPLEQDKSSRSYIERAEVYRLDERRDEEPVLDEEDYEAGAQFIGYLDRATIEAQVKQLGHLEFSDAKLIASPGLSGRRLRYAVRYVNRREQKAPFSNTVAIEPAVAVALPPADLRAEAPAQDIVTLAWSAPEANVDGSRPASPVGYNVYRRAAKRSRLELLNAEPVSETSFSDNKFDYGVEYVYVVRALSQGANGLVESADSQPLSFTPVDRFPPSAPNPVTVASANGVISLFWPTPPEHDVVGYNVYRADAADAKDWLRLTDKPVTTVTYRDERVVIDQRYFYKVTAVDRFGNESTPTDVVSEAAHP